MNEVVKYNNELNTLSFSGFTERELNNLFAIFSKLKEKNDEIISINFNELRELSDLAYRNEADFKNLMLNTYKKIQQLIIREDEIDGITRQYVLFPVVEFDKRKKRFNIGVAKDFLYFFNNLNLGHFTRFELAEFVNLSGKYTKTLYRLLKQWRKTGKFVANWDNFAEILDIPKKMAMRDVEKRILKPAIKELSAPRTLFDQTRVPFKNLTYKKTKTSGKGNKITGIEFSFTPEIDPIDDAPKTQIDAHELPEPPQKSKISKQKAEPKKEWKPEIKEFIEQMRGEKIDEFSEFIGLNLRMLDKKTKDFNTLKIEHIEQKGDKIIATFLNRDDNYRNQVKFDTAEALSNFVKKYSF